MDPFSKEKLLQSQNSDDLDDRHSLYFDANKVQLKPRNSSDLEDLGIASLFVSNMKPIVVTRDLKDTYQVGMRRRRKR